MPFQITYYDPKAGQEINEGTLKDGPYTLKLWNREVPLVVKARQ